MPATDAFIGPQPLHRIPTPQSASQNVSKILDQFQYPPWLQFPAKNFPQAYGTQGKDLRLQGTPPWAMEHEDSTQFADGESSHQLQPTSVTRTNSAAALPGQKFSPSLRDIKTWECRVRTGGGHKLVCAFIALLRSCFLLLQCDNPLALASWRTKIL